MPEPAAFTAGTFADTLPRDQRTSAPIRCAGCRSTPLIAFSNCSCMSVTCGPCACRSKNEMQRPTRRSAENRLQRLQDHPQEGGFGLGDNNQSVLDPRRQVERLTAEAKRLDDLNTMRSAAWSAASGVLANVEAWLREGVPGNCALEAVEIEPPKLLKGKDVLPPLNASDGEAANCRPTCAASAALFSRPATARCECAEEIAALARRGAVSVSALIEHDGKIEFPTQRLTSQVFGKEERVLAFTAIPDAVAMFAWTFKDALDREIEAESDDAAALTHEARQRAEAEVLSDLLAVVRAEAELVWR
jgi:hypothetical protein